MPVFGITLLRAQKDGGLHADRFVHDARIRAAAKK